MKAVMLMFDSLNRHTLPPYGCDWTHAPNFRRLAERAVTFDCAYIGSMPCMPARRELHTGRYNFMHRSWGPIEPFDDSMPEILRQNGVHTHLVSDHYHYWEDGGATYHTRYSTWECFRGQEGDPWKGHVADPEIPETYDTRSGERWRQDWINRTYMKKVENQPQAKTVAAGIEFMQCNAAENNWFLQIETFDPHEPFFTQQKYKELYPHDYKGSHWDWPNYRPVGDDPREAIEHMRFQYAALLSMCDDHLGKVLDAMDELDLWKDTLLIVNTDHGFLLGEHDCWAKGWMPWYNELAHLPLFIWDPRCGKKGERRSSLVQTIDLPATLLEYFEVDRPPDMQGQPLRETIASDTPVREAGLFGIFGGHVSVTDGRYVYMRTAAGEDNQPLFEYTHMAGRMNRRTSMEDMCTMQLGPAFAFTKGALTMKLKARKGGWSGQRFGNLLFDNDADPEQTYSISDDTIEQRMTEIMIGLMRESDAPADQYKRLGLPRAHDVNDGHRW